MTPSWIAGFCAALFSHPVTAMQCEGVLIRTPQHGKEIVLHCKRQVRTPGGNYPPAKFLACTENLLKKEPADDG